MKIYNVSKQIIEIAMREVNKKYNNNIIFNPLHELRPLNKKGTAFSFTIRCLSSKNKGHRTCRRYDFSGEVHERKHISACWHVHGDLFDTIFDLSPNAKIYTGGFCYRSKSDNWQDKNIGSMMFPVYFSESCECVQDC